VDFYNQNLKSAASLELIARQLVEGFITGLHRSPYHGFSVEFAEHRLYNSGESTRHIDWRVFARTDKLYTKQYQEETNLRCMLVLDTSASMFYPHPAKNKLTFSVHAAAALAYLLNKQRDATGLCLFSDTVEEITPVKSSPSHLDKLFITLNQLLDRKEGSKKTDVASVLHSLAEKIHRRSLVILFSDMSDGNADPDSLFKALQHLKHNKHEVIVFHVTDRSTEIEFDFADRPMEFVDLESGEKIKLLPTEVKENYRQEIAAYHQQLIIRCHQYKIDFIEADVKSDMNTILQTYLIKRAKMR